EWTECRYPCEVSEILLAKGRTLLDRFEDKREFCGRSVGDGARLVEQFQSRCESVGIAIVQFQQRLAGAHLRTGRHQHDDADAWIDAVLDAVASRPEGNGGPSDTLGVEALREAGPVGAHEVPMVSGWEQGVIVAHLRVTTLLFDDRAEL